MNKKNFHDVRISCERTKQITIICLTILGLIVAASSLTEKFTVEKTDRIQEIKQGSNR